MKKIDNYIVSEYRPSRPFGKKIGGVRNENLERLTFDNESVDLLITSDVLEHVSDLSMSLAEIYRVLKRGGYHIFTVPADYSMPKTRTRALGADGAITHLLSAAMHGDDITDGVVAFRDFGADIDAIIKRHGFSFEEDRYYSGDEHVTSVYINRKL